MAQNNELTQNQISKIQTNNKLIALYEKLKLAATTRYAQLHAKGEYQENNRKITSLIGIVLQDYTAGTGQNNVLVSYNLAPEQVQFLLTRVSAGFMDYEWSSEKIFGNPDQNGLSIVQKFTISRHNYDKNGQLLRSPWSITVENGKGIKVQNGNGGSYMQGGSYIKEKSVFIRLSDMDIYTLFKRADSYITCWENSIAGALIEAGHKQMQEQAAQQAQNQNPNGGYENGNYGSYQQQPGYYSGYSSYQQQPENPAPYNQQDGYQQSYAPENGMDPMTNEMYGNGNQATEYGGSMVGGYYAG